MRRAYNIMLSGGETKVNALKAAFRTQVFWNRHNTPELFKKYQKTFLTTDRLYGTKKVHVVHQPNDFLLHQSEDDDDKTEEMFSIIGKVVQRDPRPSEIVCGSGGPKVKSSKKQISTLVLWMK